MLSPLTPGDVLVTALVSTYNAARWLPSRLDNLLAQTIASRLQIVVIDSGSREDEGSIVETYQRLHPNVDYLRTPRETLYAAWNHGIAIARGEYLTSANTDDRLCPEALERMTHVLEQDPQLGLVYAEQWESEDELAVRSWNGCGSDEFRRVVRSRYSHRRLLLDCVVGPQPVWRRALHAQLGLFDARYVVCGDWEFWLRIAEKSPMQRIDDVLGLYYRNPAGVEHGNAELAHRERWEIRKRYFRSPSA